MEKRLIDAPNFLQETPLLKAISCYDYDLATKIIHAGADVNIPNKSHMTALHYAVINPELAHLLIKHGANVDAVNLDNQTPLHLAIESNCLETVHMLLYYNANANYQDSSGYTPFMSAIIAKNIEMQEVLIEYVVDFNDRSVDNWSILGLALAEGSPFVDEIIMRGADVNNVNSYENGALFLPFQLPRTAHKEPNLKTFKLIWDNIDYKISKWRSILGDLILYGICQFEQFLDIIIQSDKFSQVAESVCLFDDLRMLTYHFAELKLPLEKYTEIVCILLTYGYTPNSYDMSLLFNLYGYCELYRLLLFMDIRIINTDSYMLDNIPTRLMYDINFNPYQLEDVILLLNRRIFWAFEDSLALLVVRLLDYCVYPKLMNAYLSLNKTDCVTLKINSSPKVPSLVELARNATRHHIIDTFNVTNSCQLHTLIYHLDISQVYKKILTFETVLYTPIYAIKEFKNYIKDGKFKAIRNLMGSLLLKTHITF